MDWFLYDRDLRHERVNISSKYNFNWYFFWVIKNSFLIYKAHGEAFYLDLGSYEQIVVVQ